jgi:hypothetical protein
LLGFDTESFHSGQPLLDGVQPAPEIRCLGLQAWPGRVRLNRSGGPAWNETVGAPPSAEETSPSVEPALQTAAPAAASVTWSPPAGKPFGIFRLRFAKPKTSAGHRSGAIWPCSIESWHDDTS